MKKMKILAIVGSLRQGSYNKQLALEVQKRIGDRADFEILEYGDIPYMNQDIEFPAPKSIARIREKVKESDGLWFFTPEYNHTFPGVLKNLIDWLSRPISKDEGQVLARKPAAISGTTPGMSGTGIAQDQLVMLLSLLNMKIMNFPRLTIPNILQQVDENGYIQLSTTEPFLDKQIDAYLKFLESGK